MPADPFNQIQSMHFTQSCNEFLKCNRTKVPNLLVIQKSLCEQVRDKYACKKFEEKKSADSWKYQRCDYDSICQQNSVVPLDNAAACIVGAIETAIDLVHLAKSFAAGLAKSTEKQNKFLEDCDRSIDCKMQLVLYTPSQQFLTKPENAEKLKKTPSRFLWLKKIEYDSVRDQLLQSKKITREQYFKEVGISPDLQRKGVSPSQSITLSALWESISTGVSDINSEVNCYIPIEKTRLKCRILSDVLTGTGVGQAITKQLTKKVTDRLASAALSLEERRQIVKNWNRVAETSDVKKSIVATFGKIELGTEKQKKRAVDLMNSDKKIKVYTTDNVELRKMNNVIFNNEEYPTALTNMLQMKQSIALEELEFVIRQKYPKFKLEIFSDYKQFKPVHLDDPSMVINGVPVDKLIAETITKTRQDFIKEILEAKAVRASDLPEGWFFSSQGKSEGWTNLGVRSRVQDASDPSFVKKMTDTFEDGRRQHIEVTDIFKNIKTAKSDQVIQDAFELFRKNGDNLPEAKRLLEQKYQLQPLSDKQFSTLTSYYEKVDTFSPSLLNTSREYATLDGVKHGGISIDGIGLGAEHLTATSHMAFGKATTVDEMLTLARKGEVELTNSILERNKALAQKFKDATGETDVIAVCSGDGCRFALPNRAITEKESRDFLNSATNSGAEGRLRFSEVKGRINSEYNDVITKQGEDLEKALRANLNGLVDTKKTGAVNFKITIDAKSIGDGTAMVEVSTPSSLSLSSTERKNIEAAFQKALEESKMGYKQKKP